MCESMCFRRINFLYFIHYTFAVSLTFPFALLWSSVHSSITTISGSIAVFYTRSVRVYEFFFHSTHCVLLFSHFVMSFDHKINWMCCMIINITMAFFSSLICLTANINCQTLDDNSLFKRLYWLIYYEIQLLSTNHYCYFV